MYTCSISIEANPPGATPVLTHEQLWRGLVKKAENAMAFESGIDSWEIRERLEDGLIVHSSMNGLTVRYGIHLAPMVQVKYERIGGDVGGWALNLISESEKGLLLTFTQAAYFSGVTPGSVDEAKRGDELKTVCWTAIRQTLKVIRELAESKTL